MKSRITIEVDFGNGNVPVIQIVARNSDDVRDNLIKSFYQTLGNSSWCQIVFRQDVPDETLPTSEGGFIQGSIEGFKRIFITPIPDEDLERQANIMLEQVRLNNDFNSEASSVKMNRSRK